MRHEIFSVMQPGNLGGVVRRTEHDIGEQQQLEWDDVSQRQRQQHQCKMSGIESAHSFQDIAAARGLPCQSSSPPAKTMITSPRTRGEV